MHIDRDDDNGGVLLNCAVRYALGRYSYMPRLVMSEIAPMLCNLSDKTLHVMRRDVAEFLATTPHEIDGCVMDDYRDQWGMFLQQIEAEMELRKDDER